MPLAFSDFKTVPEVQEISKITLSPPEPNWGYALSEAR